MFMHRLRHGGKLSGMSSIKIKPKLMLKDVRTIEEEETVKYLSFVSLHPQVANFSCLDMDVATLIYTL